MQSNRLVRLVETVLKIKAQPQQTRQQCLASLSIAKSQFYRDLQLLNELGFSVHYSTHRKAFTVRGEPRFPLPDLSLGDILALMLSVRQQIMTVRSDFSLAYGTYAALCNIIDALPPKVRMELTKMVDKLIAKDGFGCQKATLDKLQDAAQGRQRILIDYQKADEETPCRYTADPERLYFNQGILLLDAFTPETKKIETFYVSLIKRVIKTPFLAPR